jgi:hypothetical protein
MGCDKLIPAKRQKNAVITAIWALIANAMVYFFSKKGKQRFKSNSATVIRVTNSSANQPAGRLIIKAKACIYTIMAIR